MAALDANGHYFTELLISRVQYDLEYNDGTGLYRMPKAPQLIKIAIDAGAVSIFFDAGSNYDPIWFDSTALNGDYGDQIFFNVTEQERFVWFSQQILQPCLKEVRDWVGLEPIYIPPPFFNSNIKMYSNVQSENISGLTIAQKTGFIYTFKI